MRKETEKVLLAQSNGVNVRSDMTFGEHQVLGIGWKEVVCAEKVSGTTSTVTAPGGDICG